MQTDATSANNSQHCWVLLANSVASIWHGHKSLTCFKLYATNTNIVVVPCKRRCIFSNFSNENFKNFPYPLDFARSAKLPPPPPQIFAQLRHCVLCKAPTRDIWHRGSAVISIVVVVTTRDQGRNANLLCQLGLESLKWVGTVRWPGRLFHSGTVHRKKEDSIAVLVCRNVPEAVLTCRSSGCTSTVAYFRWILIY